MSASVGGSWPDSAGENRFCGVILRALPACSQQYAPMPKPLVAIIGSGPAGLAAAEVLATEADVQVFDAMSAPGRKFLLAGKSGLNLTHAEDFEAFLDRFGVARCWNRRCAASPLQRSASGQQISALKPLSAARAGCFPPR